MTSTPESPLASRMLLWEAQEETGTLDTACAGFGVQYEFKNSFLNFKGSMGSEDNSPHSETSDHHRRSQSAEPRTRTPPVSRSGSVDDRGLPSRRDSDPRLSDLGNSTTPVWHLPGFPQKATVPGNDLSFPPGNLFKTPKTDAAFARPPAACLDPLGRPQYPVCSRPAFSMASALETVNAMLGQQGASSASVASRPLPDERLGHDSREVTPVFIPGVQDHYTGLAEEWPTLSAKGPVPDSKQTHKQETPRDDVETPRLNTKTPIRLAASQDAEEETDEEQMPTFQNDQMYQQQTPYGAFIPAWQPVLVLPLLIPSQPLPGQGFAGANPQEHMFRRPGQAQGMPTSADLHAMGNCKPCLYLPSRNGCSSGSACRFCHLPHSKKKRPRPCKQHRLQCKQLLSSLQTFLSPESEEYQQAAQHLASQSVCKSGYMKLLLTNHGKNDTPGEGSGESSLVTNDGNVDTPAVAFEDSGASSSGQNM